MYVCGGDLQLLSEERHEFLKDIMDFRLSLE